MKSLPKRSEVPAADTWDLTSLFADDADWDAALAAWEEKIPGFDAFVGSLGSSAERLADCLAFDLEMDREADRLGTYAEWEANWTGDLTTTLGIRNDQVWMNTGDVQTYGTGVRLCDIRSNVLMLYLCACDR